MTVSKHELAVNHLVSHDLHSRLKALRFIKNSVIGNRTKKDLYIQLGVVPRYGVKPPLQDSTCSAREISAHFRLNLSENLGRLVGFLAGGDNDDLQVKVQAAIVLGSFAYGNDENVSALVHANATPPLLDCLSILHDLTSSSSDTSIKNLKLLEAAARALKAIFNSSMSPKSDVFIGQHLADLVALLDASPLEALGADEAACVRIAELAASILARCCDTYDQQLHIAATGAIPLLVRLMGCGFSKAQEAALDALASLGRQNAELGKVIANTKVNGDMPTTIMMLKLVRDKCPTMRLMAATCLTNLYRTGVIPETSADVTLVVLPTLVKLLREGGLMQERAPLVLADLVMESEVAQRAAFDSDAIPRLAEILNGVNEDEVGALDMSGHTDRIKENMLVAIAAMSLMSKDCRTQAIDAKVLPHVVAGLSHRLTSVRLAACKCARSLSRSVKEVRTSLVEANVTPPLLKLLSDESTAMQAEACGVLCNIVMDFSPMKQEVIDKGGLEYFVKFTHSSDPHLRLHSVWALKNLLYKASTASKVVVIRQLTYSHLVELLKDPEPLIEEQAVSLVGNLVYGGEENVEEAFQGFGEDQLLDILESKLSWYPDSFGWKVRLTIENALLALANILVGNERHKQAIMNRQNILKSLPHFMDHERAAVRCATIWCLINMTWQEGDDNCVADRVRHLRAMGFEEKLKSMITDPEQDVRDRVRTAVSAFHAHSERMQI
ncbi:LOW QUALITY PROTEIN: armadillo-type protein [Endogone sp. FLAS-F59071]|nr:LOW QUALITY PROTEIN: armadillo-type protein [Endogone sp. FLAS-F59071]|eukprot:RUS16087.1 LOW QUALITY PROTEIN: armadillo-type protein [Endogone sp. FLAS-F59071]